MAVPDDIRAYNAALDEPFRAIAELLAGDIDTALPDAESKIWHAHPVWFLEGNPIVGYSKLKGPVRLLFWSGRAFNEPGLAPEGSFQAAEARYGSATEVNRDDLARWLAVSRDRQWDYKNIRKNRGLVPLTGV